jgi:excisionase family DNA binding protein
MTDEEPMHARHGIEPICVRVPEACRLTGIGRSKFYQLVASGEIQVVKIGSMTLVPFEGLRQFVLRGSAGVRRTSTDS